MNVVGLPGAPRFDYLGKTIGYLRFGASACDVTDNLSLCDRARESART